MKEKKSKEMILLNSDVIKFFVNSLNIASELREPGKISLWFFSLLSAREKLDYLVLAPHRNHDQFSLFNGTVNIKLSIFILILYKSSYLTCINSVIGISPQLSFPHVFKRFCKKTNVLLCALHIKDILLPSNNLDKKHWMQMIDY